MCLLQTAGLLAHAMQKKERKLRSKGAAQLGRSRPRRRYHHAMHIGLFVCVALVLAE
jgi:hypothetical protein